MLSLYPLRSDIWYASVWGWACFRGDDVITSAIPDRLPSGHTLRKIAGPLGFTEEELLIMAGFLSDQSAKTTEKHEAYLGTRLDPYVAKVLSKEPIRTQRAAIGILQIIKDIRPYI